MKIKKKLFLELLSKETERIISDCDFENHILNCFKDELFDGIDFESSLEAYTFEASDNFSRRSLNVEYIFQNRKDLFSEYISEVLEDPFNTIFKTYSDMDNVYSDAGFRWLSDAARSIHDDLLAVYSLREICHAYSNLKHDMELDSSEYGDFADEDDLVESFVSEIIAKAKSVNEILNIEGYSKSLFEEYFNLEF